jgi:hypothetical protein
MTSLMRCQHDEESRSLLPLRIHKADGLANEYAARKSIKLLPGKQKVPADGAVPVFVHLAVATITT